MPRITGRTRDRNRFTKKYPFIRAPKRNVLESTGTITIELITLSFENESTKTGTYEAPFSDNDFRVLISPRDTTNSDSANVALTIDNGTSNTVQVTVNSSAPFTGVVDVIAIRVEEGQ